MTQLPSGRIFGTLHISSDKSMDEIVREHNKKVAEEEQKRKENKNAKNSEHGN